MANRLTVEVTDYAFSRLEEVGVKREGDLRVVTLPDENGEVFEVAFKKAEKPKAEEKAKKMGFRKKV